MATVCPGSWMSQKTPLARLVEGAGGDHPRDVGAGQAEAVPPRSCLLGTERHASHVLQRQLQSAFERQQLVHAGHADDQRAIGNLDLGHDGVLTSCEETLPLR